MTRLLRKQKERPGFKRQAGQAMTEYLIVTSFALIFFFEGLDVIEELADMLRRKYDGYSYAMSMSPLPDYGTGGEMRIALADAEIDAATIDQLSVDPVEDAVEEQLSKLTDLKSQLDDVLSDFTDVSVDDIWDEVKSSAFSIF
ncbi:MAG: hypothetical protein AAF387_17870 [Pseudomonadota bacterium]